MRKGRYRFQRKTRRLAIASINLEYIGHIQIPLNQIQYVDREKLCTEYKRIIINTVVIKKKKKTQKKIHDQCNKSPWKKIKKNPNGYLKSPWKEFFKTSMIIVCKDV